MGMSKIIELNRVILILEMYLSVLEGKYGLVIIIEWIGWSWSSLSWRI